MNTVGKRIKAVRTELHFTQKEFGNKVFVSGSYISRVEADREQPTEMLLKLISFEFKCSFSWLLKGEGSAIFETEPPTIPMMNKVYKEAATSHLRECGLPEDLIQGVDCSTYENMESSLQKVKESFYLAYVENIKEARFFKRKSEKYISPFEEMDCTENGNKYIADLHSILDNNSNIGRMTGEQSIIYEELHLLYKQIEEKMGNDKETKEIMFRYDEELGKQQSLLSKNGFIAGFKTAVNLFMEAMN